MSGGDAPDLDALFVDNPTSVNVDGVGEVPVVYVPDEEPPPPVFPEDRLGAADRVVWQQVADEVVVYDPATHSSHVLNQVAGLLWQCMDGEGTLREVFADLAAAFTVPVEAIERDFVPVVAEWKRHRLVRQAGEAGARVGADEDAADFLRYLADPPNN